MLLCKHQWYGKYNNTTISLPGCYDLTEIVIRGTLGDRLGRRPIFVSCLLILSLSCVGIALTPTNDYWLLMVLRCLQAAGSASTIALGKFFLSYSLTTELRSHTRRRYYWWYIGAVWTGRFFRSIFCGTHGEIVCDIVYIGMERLIGSGRTLHRSYNRWRSVWQTGLEVSDH